MARLNNVFRAAVNATDDVAKRAFKEVGSLADDLGKMGIEVAEGGVKDATSKASRQADDAIKVARRKQQKLYDNLFSENSSALVFDRDKVITKSANGESALNSKAISKEKRRMDKEYTNAYNSIKNKGMLPSVDTANGSRAMSQQEYRKLLNDREVRSRIPDKKLAEQAERNVRQFESRSSQFEAVSKYGGKNRAKTVEEMQSRMGSKTAAREQVRNQTTQAAQAAADTKKAEARKYLTKSNIQKGVGLGVGGYLVLNMFDKGGQMSNAELYGQQQQYGSY